MLLHLKMFMKGTEQHLLADDSSSIYSRSTECLKNHLPWNSMPTILPIRHDLPEINSLAYQIALAKGSTMALETTRTRLKCSKSRNRLSLQELRNERICQQDLQEDENEFYRSCFQNLVFCQWPWLKFRKIWRCSITSNQRQNKTSWQ